MQLHQILGVGTTDGVPAWMRPSVVERVTEDLGVLGKFVRLEDLKRAYQAPLRRGEPGTVEEIFAIARLSVGAVSVRLHQPTGRGNRNFDAEVSASDWSFAVEVKHQRDRFPFNATPMTTPEGLEVFESTRPGVDYRYLDLARPDTTQPLPGSDIWRTTVAEALDQLPEVRPGVVALSVDAFGDHEIDVESALYGDEVLVARPNPVGVGSIHTSTRIGNGIFSQERAGTLVGVLAFRLRPDDHDTKVMPNWIRWYPNPLCDVANQVEVARVAASVAAADPAM